MYTIEGLGYGIFIKETDSGQIKYFFGSSTALKAERTNTGIFLSSQNVDSIGGFLLLLNSVDNTEANGVVTPFDSSAPGALNALFIFIVQNLQGGYTVPGSNIWTQTGAEITPTDNQNTVVLGDPTNGSTFPLVIHGLQDNDTSANSALSIRTKFGANTAKDNTKVSYLNCSASAQIAIFYFSLTSNDSKLSGNIRVTATYDNNTEISVREYMLAYDPATGQNFIKAYIDYASIPFDLSFDLSNPLAPLIIYQNQTGADVKVHAALNFTVLN
jgi:hypothetical protein